MINKDAEIMNWLLPRILKHVPGVSCSCDSFGLFINDKQEKHVINYR